MLSKEVCKRCTIASFRGINDEVGEVIFENPEQWWSKEDGLRFDKSHRVYCIAQSGFISTEETPPRNCPYELEHILFKE